MSGRAPFQYFANVYTVAATAAPDTYQVSGVFGTDGDVYESSNAPNDDTTELGDIRPDDFNAVITSAALGTVTYSSIAYDGKSLDGNSVVGTHEGTSLLFTNDTYATGTTVSTTDQPFVLTQTLCFLAGTRIATACGEVAVEALQVGDAVVTWSGAHRPITWLGSSTTLINEANPARRPVIVRKDALQPGVPVRDLRVTGGHSLYLDEVLIPAETLINGRSILRDDTDRVIELYHVELDAHDVLIADGAPAESYRDDGNRRSFSRASGSALGRPNPAPCAPVLTAGPTVDAVWRRLMDRAGGVDPALRADPDLHLIVDGKRLDPVAREGAVWRFAVSGAVGDIRIASRSVVPTLAGTGRDHRRLGVALRRLVLSGGAARLEIGYDAEVLAVGFQEPEHGEGFRWTNGAGVLPRRAHAAFDIFDLSLEVGCLARYPVTSATGTERIRLRQRQGPDER